MQRDDEIRLRHMLDAAREVLSFAQGRTRNDLEYDRQLVLALVKDIEILGEAATHVTGRSRLSTPEIPWERIVGMRNRRYMYTSTSTSISSGRPCMRTCRN